MLYGYADSLSSQKKNYPNKIILPQLLFFKNFKTRIPRSIGFSFFFFNFKTCS